MRALLVCGASAVVKAARRRPDRADPWVVSLIGRKRYKVALGAVAARMARTIWAMLRSGEEYRPRLAPATTADMPVVA